jgi:ribosomal protein L11 methyltransferase
MSTSARFVHRWTRRVPAHREDEWRERLFDPDTSLVVHGHPGRPTVRLEVYGPTAALRRLARVHGGKVARIDAAALATRANAPRRPLRPLPQMGIVDAHGRWPANRPKPRSVLRIAGAMAFGTGEHATTAACLRLLAAEVGRLAPGWTLLDVGTGSGILAIAAEKLGAVRVEAFDNDPRAVTAAQANLRRNRCRRISLSTRDVLRWRPARRHPLVIANILSEILRAAAPRLKAALQPGACLILSGILRQQEEEVLETFGALGLIHEKTARRGRWSSLQMRAPERRGEAPLF